VGKGDTVVYADQAFSFFEASFSSDWIGFSVEFELDLDCFDFLFTLISGLFSLSVSAARVSGLLDLFDVGTGERDGDASGFGDGTGPRLRFPAVLIAATIALRACLRVACIQLG
jgi:hypothetical protein